MQTKKIVVSGKVQGVFFRRTALKQAQLLGIKGAVKNLSDGKTVEILATAPLNQLYKFIEWCKQGPPKAIVQHVIVSDLERIEFDEFRIL